MFAWWARPAEELPRSCVLSAAEWRRVRDEMNKVWKKVFEQNYHRSLDHRWGGGRGTGLFRQQQAARLWGARTGLSVACAVGCGQAKAKGAVMPEPKNCILPWRSARRSFYFKQADKKGLLPKTMLQVRACLSLLAAGAGAQPLRAACCHTTTSCDPLPPSGCRPRPCRRSRTLRTGAERTSATCAPWPSAARSPTC